MWFSNIIKHFNADFVLHCIQTSNCECMTAYIIAIISDNLITDDKYATKSYMLQSESIVLLIYY